MTPAASDPIEVAPVSREKRRDRFRLRQFLFSPGTYFREAAAKPPWVMVFLISSAATALIGWWTLPFASRAFLQALPAGMSEQQLDGMRLGQNMGVLVSPVILLVKSGLSAVLLLMLAVSITGTGTFRQALSLVAHLLPFAVLQGLHTLVVLHLKGLGSISGPLDLQVPLGLNLLLHGLSPVADAALGRINLYEGFGFVYLVIGVRAFFKCTRPTATAVSAAYWIVGTAVTVGMAMIGQALQRGAGGIQ